MRVVRSHGVVDSDEQKSSVDALENYMLRLTWMRPGYHRGFGTLLEGGTGYSSLDSHGTKNKHRNIYDIYIYDIYYIYTLGVAPIPSISHLSPLFLHL